jgi:type IV secretory pathway VirD2 relaxase
MERSVDNETMNRRDEDRFQPKVRGSRGRRPPSHERFVTRVLREASRAGHLPTLGSTPKRTRVVKCSRIGRGHAAAQFAGASLGPYSRRVVVKTRIVKLRTSTPQAVDAHLRYIIRGGVGYDGQPGQLYGPETDSADWREFAEAGRKDRHQFRMILAPEDGVELTDLRDFTRQLMRDVERDLGTRLEWVAVDHWDTDNPHTHLVLRGKDETGRDLIIARDYITDGMRKRASELATEWLGLRSELEIRQSLQREVTREAWTGLDQQLQALARDGPIDLARPNADVATLHHRSLLIGRLQVLAGMGLAEERDDGTWALKADGEATLRAMGERGDIVRTMQRALGKEHRQLAIYDARRTTQPIIGRVIATGYLDELEDRGYAIVDGIDGRAHHVPLGKRDPSELKPGSIVEVRPTQPRVADRNIAALSRDGLYLTSEHRDLLRSRDDRQIDAEDILDAHTRRLEALRRAGIVERIQDGAWRVPADLVARGQTHDRQRTKGIEFTLHSDLPLDKQVTAVGATWLDRQLIRGESSLASAGFGATVRDALRARADFLVEQGFAQPARDGVKLPRKLLAMLRERELETVAKTLAAETGLSYRTLSEGQSFSGTYQRMVSTASGRFAMLDNGLGFSLVPWRPVIEQRLGQTISATLHGDHVIWSLGRQRGLSR